MCSQFASAALDSMAAAFALVGQVPRACSVLSFFSLGILGGVWAVFGTNQSQAKYSLISSIPPIYGTPTKNDA